MNRQKYTTSPCERCKAHHKKCEVKRPCSYCMKSQAQCEISSGNFKFRQGSKPKPSYDFSPDQTWVDYSQNDELRLVHVDPKSRKVREQSPQHQRDSLSSQTSEEMSSALSHPVEESPLQMNQQADVTVPPNQRREGISDWQETRQQFAGNMQIEPPTHENTTASRSLIRTASKFQDNIESDPMSLFPPQRRGYSFGPLKGLPEHFSQSSYTSLEEACLIRHFTEYLSSWFDTCDRDRHFELNVPERAMFCPVLRYAIYTASAGHLTRLAACRHDSNNVVIFDGIPLPGITSDSAIRYHDVCISYLIELSHDPKEEYNEDVLAAATILRFYEQIDTPSYGMDSEAYLNAVQFIVNTQQDESFYATYKIHGPRRDEDVHTIPSVSLRHSACLSALRQEIWSAFLNQRPFRMPVSSDNNYNFFDNANDFTWTNRILIWCADLLKFCFGHRKSMSDAEIQQRWQKLKLFELNWETKKPAAFTPIYYQDADLETGKVFPTIWHMNACQVIGAQHIELSRILLAVSNPALSRLGLGARSNSLILEKELQSITRRLCGLAVSNLKYPTSLVNAAIGVSICGEYVAELREQKAVIQLLTDLEYLHGWPTQATILSLQEAWKIKSGS